MDRFGQSKGFKVVIPSAENGHLSLNAPMVYSKNFSKDVIFSEVRDVLLEKFPEAIDKVEEVNNFINIWLKNGYIDLLSKYFLEKDGKVYTPKPQNINVEFISANPTGTLHLGHLRGIYGDMLASVFSSIGHNVTREYYINNMGHQVDVLAESVFYQYSKIAGFEHGEPTEKYPGHHIEEIAKKIYEERPDFTDFAINTDFFRKRSIDYMISLAKGELQKLNINYDVWRYESDVHQEGKVEAAIKILSGSLEYGVPEQIEDDEYNSSKEKCLIFKNNPEDKGKVVQRPNGLYTYFAGDLGYYYDKYARGFERIIMFLGADHDAHGKYLKKAVEKMNLGVDLEIVTVQIMIFQSNGNKLKFSKRDGVTLSPSEILEYIQDPQLLRFIIANKSPESHTIVDIDELTNISLDNPYYYIQYAHARCCSIIRNSGKSFTDADFDFGSYPKSMQILLWKLLQWPNELKVIESTLKVHRLTHYLYDLSKDFHFIWNEGKTKIEYKWLSVNQVEQDKKISLLRLFKEVLKSGLEVLGIEANESMNNEKNI